MIVWVWTIAAGLGAMISAWNLMDAYRDYAELGDVQNGRRIIGLGWVRSEAIRFLIQGSWSVIGVLALLQIPGPFVEVLVASAVALALNTVLGARDRIRLRRILR